MVWLWKRTSKIYRGTLEKLKMSTSKKSASVVWNFIFLFLENFFFFYFQVVIENSENKEKNKKGSINPT